MTASQTITNVIIHLTVIALYLNKATKTNNNFYFTNRKVGGEVGLLGLFGSGRFHST